METCNTRNAAKHARYYLFKKETKEQIWINCSTSKDSFLNRNVVPDLFLFQLRHGLKKTKKVRLLIKDRVWHWSAVHEELLWVWNGKLSGRLTKRSRLSLVVPVSLSQEHSTFPTIHLLGILGSSCSWLGRKRKKMSNWPLYSSISFWNYQPFFSFHSLFLFNAALRFPKARP